MLFHLFTSDNTIILNNNISNSKLVDLQYIENYLKKIDIKVIIQERHNNHVHLLIDIPQHKVTNISRHLRLLFSYYKLKRIQNIMHLLYLILYLQKYNSDNNNVR